MNIINETTRLPNFIISKSNESSYVLRFVPSPSLIFISTTLLLMYFYFRRTVSGLHLPPSPPKHWMHGNASQLNPPHRHVAFATEYKERYGDIISFTTPTETQIILNTAELATNLLDKQSAYTSNRIYSVMANDIMNWGSSVVFHPYNERLKKLRRVTASALHLTAAKSYASQHRDSAIDLIRLIIAKPDEFSKHVHWVTGAFILRMVYGYTVTRDDPILQTAREAVTCLGKGLSGLYWVNYFPMLKYVPTWVPGAGFQVLGRKGRALRNRMVNEPFYDVLDQVRHDKVKQPSYTSRLLEEKGGINVSKEDAELIRLTAGSMLSAGSGTVAIVITFFVLEMALHPELAKVAQAEIDSVIGRERFPILSDRDSLPFFEATILEVMRLWPPAPLGVAHCTSQEIEFQGYRIPKGATLYANIWAMLRDPNQYKSPHTFDPARFLKPVPDPDPRRYIFGFGKRLCQGINVANNSTFIMCASLLSVFDITMTPELAARVESLGGPDSADIYKLCSPTGLLLDLLPFSVDFKLRDQAAAGLVEGTSK